VVPQLGAAVSAVFNQEVLHEGLSQQSQITQNYKPQATTSYHPLLGTKGTSAIPLLISYLQSSSSERDICSASKDEQEQNKTGAVSTGSSPKKGDTRKHMLQSLT
jgi:hypothetical protein